MKWSCDIFWSRRPALLYGLCGAISFYAFFDSSPYLKLLLLFIAVTSAASWKRLLIRSSLIVCISAAVASYASVVYDVPELPEEGLDGAAVFSIDRVSTSQTHFGVQWNYHGTIKRFSPIKAKNLPCTIYFPAANTVKRPPADKDYLVKGRLKKGKSGRYSLLPKKNSPWMPITGSSSLANWRYHTKNAVKAFFKKNIQDTRSAEFLSGIFTGEFEDRVMRAEFSRLGLQHLLAISGFHFALLTSLAAFFLRLIFPHKVMALLLSCFVVSYFFFLGASPSILRAWMMSFIVLLGCFSERKSDPLNALGITLIAILLYDPLVLGTIGFQFSAIVTAAILIFYPLAGKFLEKVFVKRSVKEMRGMSRFDQHCFCLLSILREGLALALAVNIAAIPLCLYYFGKFPVLSLLYNLFIPFLVSLSMFQVAVASLSFLIFEPLAKVLFSIASVYTHFTLNFIYNAPYSLNIYWVLGGIPFSLILLVFTTVFFFAARHSEKLILTKS